MPNDTYTPDKRNTHRIFMIDEEALKSLKIICLGDIMLDVFISGNVDRMSPEAPVPVLCPKSSHKMPGGIGNVAANLSKLGVKPYLISVVGDDSAHTELKSLLESDSCNISGLHVDHSRPTTTKKRYVSGGKHLLRVDEESTSPLPQDLITALKSKLQSAIPECDALIISDYKKGVVSEALCQHAIRLAKKAGIPVILDPKGNNYAPYSGADIITPNTKGLADGTNMPVTTKDEIIKAAQYLINTYGFGHVLVTRSEAGMSLVCANKDPVHIPAQTKEVFDVSGAGDTVIATLAAMLALKLDIKDAVNISNLAAGIVVSKSGTSTVSIEELQRKIDGR